MHHMAMTHVVVDGSNIATEGRTAPSLAQLDEAVRAFLGEYGEHLALTVVVDATFGHRIDPKEKDAFDAGIVNGELINRKFDKGTGIKAICGFLGCSLADTIGFGDSDNDLQMTDVVGISVCMANGSDNLKKRCDRICPAVSEDGVAKEFAELGLI